MYHEAAKKMGSILGGFTPIKKLFFPAIGSSLSFTKIAAHAVLSNSRVASESLPRNFCGLVIHIKNTFCKKIGSKRSFQPSAVVRAIYPSLYRVPAANKMINTEIQI